MHCFIIANNKFVLSVSSELVRKINRLTLNKTRMTMSGTMNKTRTTMSGTKLKLKYKTDRNQVSPQKAKTA